jgi:hypothetical protein
MAATETVWILIRFGATYMLYELVIGFILKTYYHGI